ncbi:hypothetical protein XH99_10830 [Bradyrhizobium nanningense]|uniref:Uncharacterized protein n=1 Tax=Bradyrhizobium nanningense TaxID=1325118 RepID=A0A4Q0S5W7_9BRAD|nr:hypothetical protein XH84_20800 [Bradyrhizobium nanningense]RXH31429.1 hypothetical protein XH99_10830 [Bradyrhizobium nanningense]
MCEAALELVNAPRELLPSSGGLLGKLRQPQMAGRTQPLAHAVGAESDDRVRQREWIVIVEQDCRGAGLRLERFGIDHGHAAQASNGGRLVGPI